MLANDSTIASIVFKRDQDTIPMEMKMCVERYISDLKQQIVNIKHPIDAQQSMLLVKAYEFAKVYYRNLFGMNGNAG